MKTEIEYCNCSSCRSDEPALTFDWRLEMWFCSLECADKEIENRKADAEHERLRAEISSGGQI